MDKICLFPYHCFHDDEIQLPTGIKIKSKSECEYLDKVIQYGNPKFFIEVGEGYNSFSDLFMLMALALKKTKFTISDSTLHEDMINAGGHVAFNGDFIKYKGVWFYDADS